MVHIAEREITFLGICDQNRTNGILGSLINLYATVQQKWPRVGWMTGDNSSFWHWRVSFSFWLSSTCPGHKSNDMSNFVRLFTDTSLHLCGVKRLPKSSIDYIKHGHSDHDVTHWFVKFHLWNFEPHNFQFLLNQTWGPVNIYMVHPKHTLL